MIRKLVCVLVLLTIAGCSKDTPSSGNQSAKPVSEKTTPQQLADKIGCSNVHRNDGPTTLGVREEAVCELNGGTLYLFTFNDTAQRDSYAEMADQFTGVYVTGEDWRVDVDTTEIGQQVASSTGGELH